MADKVARWDLRQTHKFFKTNPRIALVMSVALLLAGLFSILGWMRWTLPVMEWSFAVLVWAAALYCLGVGVKMGLQKAHKDDEPRAAN